jgi:hypothetical protein
MLKEPSTTSNQKNEQRVLRKEKEERLVELGVQFVMRGVKKCGLKVSGKKRETLHRHYKKKTQTHKYSQPPRNK